MGREPFRMGDIPKAEDLKGCAYLVGGLVTVLAVLTGIGLAWNAAFKDDPPRPPTFAELIDEGADCQELFAVRNSWDPKSPQRKNAAGQLFQIGCESSSSTRTDIGEPTTTMLQVDEVSTDCRAVVSQMERTYNTASNEDFEALSSRSVTACSDADMWLAATRAHPGSIGLVSADYVQATDLAGPCHRSAEAPACVDAFSRGLIPQ